MKNKENRVAVIAIHGVADQKPKETAQRVSDLLLGLKRDDIAYPVFNRTDLRVPVREVVFDRVPSRKGRALANAFRVDPRAQCMKRVHQRSPDQSISGALADVSGPEAGARERAVPSGDDAELLDHVYMREQLSEYEPTGEDALYDSVRLTGSRMSAGQGRCEVHIYEMFWADLSRMGSGLLRALVEFYQLLFYLCGLGRKSLDFAHAHYPRDLRWKCFSGAQYCAEQLLTLAIPVLNLCLLGLSSVLLPVYLPPPLRDVAIAGGSGLLVGMLIGWALYAFRYRASPDFWPWAIFVVLLGGAGGGLAGASLAARTSDPLQLLALLAWLVSAALIVLSMQFYQSRKPGAAAAGVLGVLVVSMMYCLMLWLPGGDNVLDAALQTAELTLLLLALCWFGFALFCLATSVTGFLAVGGVKQPAERESARRASWTVDLTLILPGLLVMLMNLVVWKALYLLGNRLIPTTPHTPVHLLADLPEFANWSDSAREFVGRLIDTAASPFFVVGILVGFVAVLLAFWSLIPVVLSEFQRAPRNPRQTVWLGRCLSRSFPAMRVSGEILRAMAVLGIPFAILLSWLNWHQLRDAEWISAMKPVAPWLLTLLGSFLVLVLSGSKGPFEWLALGFRAVLDVALDAANWLRLHPIASNPKARITTRFVSLLRYLCNWKASGNGDGYKAIIIVAHSQGTVIAAEVLRFLRIANRDPLLERLNTNIPVFLFTMGCPLRQLYSLRFPHHYGWARHDSRAWPGGKPDPATLGVKLWVNAYRSGDYVGRYLWHPDAGETQWTKREQEADKVEFCIGAGAHNRYWDETAPEIAAELDRLIEIACRDDANP